MTKTRHDGNYDGNPLRNRRWERHWHPAWDMSTGTNFAMIPSSTKDLAQLSGCSMITLLTLAGMEAGRNHRIGSYRLRMQNQLCDIINGHCSVILGHTWVDASSGKGSI